MARSVASSSAPARSVPSGRGRLPTWVVRIFFALLRFMRMSNVRGPAMAEAGGPSLHPQVQRPGELLHGLPFLLHGAAHLLGRARRDGRAVLVELPSELRVLRRLDEQRV